MKTISLLTFLLFITFNSYSQSSVSYFGEMIQDPYKKCADGRIVQIGPYKVQHFTSYTGVDLLNSGRSITPKVKLKLLKGEYINQAFIFGGISGLSKKSQVCLNFNNSAYSCINGNSNLNKVFYFSTQFCNSNNGCLSPIISNKDNYSIDVSLGLTGDEDLGNGNRIDWDSYAPNIPTGSTFAGKVLAMVCIRK